MLRPSGLSVWRSAIATRFAVAIAAWRSTSSTSKSVAACVFVITRQWPEFSGLMSMMQNVRSSS
jgi:hypothetical protein